MEIVRWLISVALLITVIACSSGAGTSSRPSSAASGGTTIAADEKEFAITLDKNTIAPGETTFAIRNSGTVTHEFVVVDTDTAASGLPQANGEVDEAQLEVVDEVEDLAAGATDDLTVNLPAGHYAIICNIPGHYAGGMHVDLTVQ